MNANRFFVLDCDGFATFETEDKAKTSAELSLDHFRREALQDGEWSDDAGSVCWGEIRQQAVETTDGEFTDFVLRDLHK
jgi:hypothetical protein